MTDPGIQMAQRIARMRDRIQLRWDEDRTQRVKQHALRRRRQQVVLRAVAVLILVLAGPLLLWPRHQALQLWDHSRAEPVGAIHVKEDTPRRTVVEVLRGRARFDVVRRPDRLFRVEAGGVVVEVLGTAFTVERATAQVTVAVERGRVRVSWDGQQAELVAGQRGTFPAGDPSPPAVPQKECPLPAGVVAAGPRDAPSLTARPRTTRGPAALFAEADAARRDRRPAAALAALEQLLREHRTDPRAPLAAFTIGKLLLEELDRAEAAARSFALAQALDPGGVLAQDALAREVEAWTRAGNGPRARERAEEYVNRYPSGPRLHSVRHDGRLE